MYSLYTIYDYLVTTAGIISVMQADTHKDMPVAYLCSPES